MRAQKRPRLLHRCALELQRCQFVGYEYCTSPLIEFNLNVYAACVGYHVTTAVVCCYTNEVNFSRLDVTTIVLLDKVVCPCRAEACNGSFLLV